MLPWYEVFSQTGSRSRLGPCLTSLWCVNAAGVRKMFLCVCEREKLVEKERMEWKREN